MSVDSHLFTRADLEECRKENEEWQEWMVQQGNYCRGCGTLDYSKGKDCEVCKELINII